jgi:hypothetical protein
VLEALCFDMNKPSPFKLYYAGIRAIQSTSSKAAEHDKQDGEDGDGTTGTRERSINPAAIKDGANLLFQA